MHVLAGHSDGGVAHRSSGHSSSRSACSCPTSSSRPSRARRSSSPTRGGSPRRASSSRRLSRRAHEEQLYASALRAHEQPWSRSPDPPTATPKRSSSCERSLGARAHGAAIAAWSRHADRRDRAPVHASAAGTRRSPSRPRRSRSQTVDERTVFARDSAALGRTASAATPQLHAPCSPRTTWCGTATSFTVARQLRLSSTRASCAPRDRPAMRWPRPSACSITARSWPSTTSSFKRALVEGVEAALELSDARKAEELLTHPRVARSGELTPFLQAQRAPPPRSSGGRARQRGRHRRALRQRRRPLPRVRHGLPPRRHGARARRVACCLQGRRDEAEPLLAEAREIFEQLEATPWLERPAAVAATQP